MNIKWEDYRSEKTGEINMHAVWRDHVSSAMHESINDFFNMISQIRPVKSRQVAAVALAYAIHIKETLIEGKYRR
jgi:hypothetical protein